MLVVAGLSLANLKPRVWDQDSPYYLPDLQAVMISYAEFHQMPGIRKAAMELGIRAHFGIPDHIRIYLDNGAFYFLGRTGETPRGAYDDFVHNARPDWSPIPQDFIPTPKMSEDEQRNCYTRTMDVNRAYLHNGYVPVIHVSRLLEEYTAAIRACDRLLAKPAIALGGIVPNLLRAPKAMPYQQVLSNLAHVRTTFADKSIHVFGIGGTATLHIASLLGMDSADSSGWRNRAARGIIQLPGSGDRSVANLGKWRGREPSTEEWDKLRACTCPACARFGLIGLRVSGIQGFCNRATHNLWVLLKEASDIDAHLLDGTYPGWYRNHLDNSTYLRLIQQLASSIGPRC